jgi:hypothetical protein
VTADHQSGFGRFLACVAERDIDLLLMEEFHVSGSFVKWFCERLDISDAQPDGAWHSVADTDGETDLLLRVIAAGERIGILIENKVAAPEQDMQAERYHLRGIRSREAGKFDRYVTVICAPARYLGSLSLDSPYEHRISYEDIASWFASGSDKRSHWRNHIMMEAIEQGRRGYTMTVNESNSRFHLEYWKYLTANHPQLVMAKPGNKGSKSNWIIMKGPRFPKGVKLHHKIDQRTMELGFEGRTIEDVLAAARDWPEEVRVMQKGRTASLVVDVPAIHMGDSLEQQRDALEVALAVAHRLYRHAKLFEGESFVHDRAEIAQPIIETPSVGIEGK